MLMIRFVSARFRAHEEEVQSELVWLGFSYVSQECNPFYISCHQCQSRHCVIPTIEVWIRQVPTGKYNSKKKRNPSLLSRPLKICPDEGLFIEPF